jgi:autotransporter-associated beta strand protein
MKLGKLVNILASLALLAGGKTALAGSHTWSGAINGNWSNPGNWSFGGAPSVTEVSPVTLQFPPGAVRYNTTNDIGGWIFFLTVDYMNVTGNNYLFAGGNQQTPALSLSGYSGGLEPNLKCTGTNIVFDTSLTLYLGATSYVQVAASAQLNLEGFIEGPGGLTFNGTGSTYVAGGAYNSSTGNSFTGTVQVNSGNLYLQNWTVGDGEYGPYLDELPAFGGSLIVGVVSNSAQANVYVSFADQFTTNCDIVVNPTGALWVYRTASEESNFWYSTSFVIDDWYLNNECRSLTLNGGKLYLGTVIYVAESDYYTGDIIFLGTNYSGLKVDSNFVSNVSPNPSTTSWAFGSGGLSLYGCASVTAGPLLLGCSSSGFTKSGPGTVYLEGSGSGHYDLVVAQGLADLLGANMTLYGLSVSNGAELDITQPCTVYRDVALSGRGLQGNGGALTVESSAVTFSLNDWLSIRGDTAINVINPTDQLLLMASGFAYTHIAGTNNLFKLGAGNLTFADFNSMAVNPSTTNYYTPVSNLFSGTFFIEGGSVNVNSAYPPTPGTGGVAVPSGVALSCPIVVGTNGSKVACTLELDANQQLSTNVSITINDGCHLDIEGTNRQTLAALTLNGGVLAGLGEIVLNGDVTANFATYQPYIYTDLSLGGAYRSFTVGSNTIFSIQSSITDDGDFVGVQKYGPGELQLTAANPYSGFTEVFAGRLGLYSLGSPGSINSSTLVAPGAEVALEGGVNVNVAELWLSGTGTDGNGVIKGAGNNTWKSYIAPQNDLIVNVASNGVVVLDGTVSSTSGGLIKTGLGTLELVGDTANAWPGATAVQQGTLELAKTNVSAVPGPLVVGTGAGPANSAVVELLQPGQLDPGSAVTLNSDGLLDLVPTTSSSVGSVSGSGEINLGFAQLSVGLDNTSNTFSGPILGFSSAAVVKAGTGAWILTGVSSFFGQTRVGAGTLFVDGYLGNGSIFVSNSATLGGNGSVGTLIAFGGATISPGHSPGLLNSGSVTFNPGSLFVVEINGTNGGSAYDQLNVTGAVTENNPILQVKMTIPGATNNQYVIVNNDATDPVTGTFAGLPEGATVIANNGAHFTISYHGSIGSNDVVLTQTTVPSAARPQLTSIARLTSGNITLSGSGTPNAIYHVQANTNLMTTNWINLGPVTADGLGALVFTDSQAALYSERFYRFVYP